MYSKQVESGIRTGSYTSVETRDCQLPVRICNKRDHDCVFLSPLVSIDHLHPTEHHLCANLNLRSAGLVVDATAAPVARARPNNVNDHMNQPHNDSVTVWHSHWYQRPHNSSSLPHACCCRRCSLYPAVTADAVAAVSAMAAEAATRACSR